MIYGEQYAAGLSIATVLGSFDFETYSEAGYVFTGGRWHGLASGKPGLAGVGAWAYSRHASTEVTTFYYDLKDGAGQRSWHPGRPNPQPLFGHLAAGRLIEATNSFFDWCIWSNVCVRLYGWPVLPLTLVRDVAAKCGNWTLPRKLELAADVLKTPIRKDKIGAQAMQLSCKPRNPTKKDDRQRLRRADSPVLFATLDQYCGLDVGAQDCVSARTPDLSPTETRIFLADQAINARGVRCDRKTVEASLDIIAQASARYNAQLQEITRGAVGTTDELDKMKTWLASQGIDAPSITKDTIEELIKASDGDARRVLQLRERMGSLSVKKTAAMAARMDPTTDRLHGLYTYAGAARTWRWSGAGVQSQNLPKEGPKVQRCVHCSAVRWSGLWFCPSCFRYEAKPAKWGIEAAEACIPALLSRSLDTVEMLWGDALLAIAGCLRSFFIAGPGMDLVSSDLSAIEAVVIAELAGEDWQRIVFRGDGRIYEETAARITGVPLAEFARYKAESGLDHPQRALGKVAALASAFGGWVQAWLNFGAGEFLSEDEIKEMIIKWRKQSPMIVKLWAGLEGAAVSAVLNPGEPHTYRSLSFQTHGDVLYLALPSGRNIAYHHPRAEQFTDDYGRLKWHILYRGVDSQSGRWVGMDTYGPKLAENATQAIARDIFAAGIIRLEDAGYPVVMHTHDEPTCEVPAGSGAIEQVETLMTIPLDWCAEYPVKAAGGWRGQRYRKS